MSETNRIEYKRELNTNVDLEKEVIAFLNYHEGGLIYIGIDKQGEILGVSDIDGDMLKIKDRIKNNISPSAMGLFDIVAETKEGKELIKIIVAGGPEKPYFKKKFGMTEKGCYIRTGTAAEPMPQVMIDKLFASRTRNSLGKIKSHRQDLTFEQLKIYYEEKGLTLTKRFKQNLELLTEDEKLNYVAYLLGDENGTSIKVAKYSGTDRVDLIENNEYGYCSLIKATKRVIDKLELENRTSSRITSKERIDKRLWNAVALREAIINAVIHNDYTREIPPKFEIFSDRLEITSYGGLFEGMTQEDFFDGLSLPRNKELMRVYKDLGMVEQLGSGVPRILQAYSKNCFKFADSYLRLIFPATEKVTTQVTMQVTTQVTTQVEELIKVFTGEHTRQELQAILNLANREHFRKNYLQPSINANLIELTIPEKPNSSKQKYRLTERGILVKNSMA
jgi:predicted HTH transcriptional regulator